MMKQLGIMTLLVLAFITRPAVAQDHQGTWPKEPKTFRGVPFNATFDQAKAILQQPNQCTTSVSGHVEECPVEMGGSSISGINIERPTLTSNLLLDDTTRIVTVFFFADYGKTFNEIRLSFYHNDWNTVKSAFIEKYGPPSTTHTKTLRNGLGVTIDGEELAWIGSGVVLELDEYDNDLRVSSGFISTLSNFQKKVQEERDKTKAAATKF